jgi:hypothetical protein
MEATLQRVGQLSPAAAACTLHLTLATPVGHTWQWQQQQQ